jgi:hypothetical protein
MYSEMSVCYLTVRLEVSRTLITNYYYILFYIISNVFVPEMWLGRNLSSVLQIAIENMLSKL